MRRILLAAFSAFCQMSSANQILSADDYKKACLATNYAECRKAYPEEQDRCDKGAFHDQLVAMCNDNAKTFCKNTTTVDFTPAGCRKLPPGSRDTPNLAQAQADLDACQSAVSSAQSCCGDPKSCGGNDTSSQLEDLRAQAQQASDNGDQQSLKIICNEANEAGGLSSSMNSSYAEICSVYHSGCSLKCQNSYQKWIDQKNDCTGDCD